ncbi:hypothetical protein [Micromonospora sp. NPDC048898]|uniref:hypothetical protein n=1 Tax=Micromonospora sp. NPDC048898 TaxID=3364260 RepID=UPI00371AAF87
MATPVARRTGHRQTYVVLGWAAAYGGVRLAWTVGEAPALRRFGPDLLGFTAWWSVALCLAVAVVAVALDRTTTWRPDGAWGLRTMTAGGPGRYGIDIHH